METVKRLVVATGSRGVGRTATQSVEDFQGSETILCNATTLLSKPTGRSTSKGVFEQEGLKRKAATEETQEAAVAEDGVMESRVQPLKTAAFPPGFSISEIKNKQCGRKSWQLRKTQREALSDKVPPKPVPKTRDNHIYPHDEEVVYDEATDKFVSYFNRQTSPKILITISVRLYDHFSAVIPNSHAYYRRALVLKKLFHIAISRDFTDLIVINEDHKMPNGLILSQLPNGSVAQFEQCSSLKKLRRGNDPIVATFHNQQNYIIFGCHRYIFKSEKKMGIQELAPHFTLKLGSLQKGTFDSKYGEYECVHKPWEMDRSRRKFHL
uniref:Ribosome production factor 1 n=1 Tax=Capra hircus TaxID=9925 RepID=A0A452FRH4_CAPHI